MIGCTNLTGRFPYPSSRGNNYILLAYHYDANAILVTALKNRNATTITLAWETLNTCFQQAGTQPTMYILDNECSHDFKNAFMKTK